jgi:hypothetical protein
VQAAIRDVLEGTRRNRLRQLQVMTEWMMAHPWMTFILVWSLIEAGRAIGVAVATRQPPTEEDDGEDSES